MHELLNDWPVVVEIPVAWGDMDAFQHVNNARFFTYFESSRLAYFQKIEFLDLKEQEMVGPILAWIDCRFRLPLTYPDTIFVGSRVTEMGEDRFTMVHRLVSEAHGLVAAEGSGLIVTYDYNLGQKAPIPSQIRSRIADLDRPGPMKLDPRRSL